jgi:hypothetical protein
MLTAIEEIKPVKIYNNFKDDRNALIKDNQGKIGVYVRNQFGQWSKGRAPSTNLAKVCGTIVRNSFLSQWLRPKNKNMPITKALLKYGQHSFAVLIVEYADTYTINIRETDWITRLLPYYNVLKQGYSSPLTLPLSPIV